MRTWMMAAVAALAHTLKGSSRGIGAWQVADAAAAVERGDATPGDGHDALVTGVGFVAGYLALNAAALYTAVMFGIQPLIASAPDGHPLYAPFPLSVTVPVMALQHLFLFGIVEGVATALIIRYLQAADPALLSLNGGGGEVSAGTVQRLRFGLGILVLLSPLGVILPLLGGAKSGWGEWRAAELTRLTSFVPAGMKRLGELWQAPLPDYAFAGPGAGVVTACLAYLLSAALGIALLLYCARACGRLLTVREEK